VAAALALPAAAAAKTTWRAETPRGASPRRSGACLLAAAAETSWRGQGGAVATVGLALPKAAAAETAWRAKTPPGSRGLLAAADKGPLAAPAKCKKA
jgi:hypothetical protein